LNHRKKIKAELSQRFQESLQQT